MTNPRRRLLSPRPLESAWQLALDAVLSVRFGLSTSKPADIAKLIPKVEALSRAYNLANAEGEQSKLPLEARIAFSFPRDVPKGAAAVRELLAFDKLLHREKLRVIDLGAGLGAMTWGLARSIEQHGHSHGHDPKTVIDALLTDEDVDALRAAEAIATSAIEHHLLKRTALTIRTRSARLQTGSSFLKDAEPADVVFLGQVLSELAPRDRPEDRLAMQKELVTDILQRLVRPDGALVIVEPALRDRTRHLHALRDQLIPTFTVFAPCLHQKSCPALAIETEWCHEDLVAVDLPSWVVPIARGAGLRWQGLTFSYLILRKDGRSMTAPNKEQPPTALRFRAISSLIGSKGKTELFICDDRGQRQRLRRLDRDEKAYESGIAHIERGDIVTISDPDSNASAPVVDDRGRIVPQANVAIDVGEGRK